MGRFEIYTALEVSLRLAFISALLLLPSIPMTSAIASTLHHEQFSLRHNEWLRVMAQTPNLLVIQDQGALSSGNQWGT